MTKPHNTNQTFRRHATDSATGLRVLVVSPDYPPPFVGGSLGWIYQLVDNSRHCCEVLAAVRPAGDAGEDLGRQHVRRLPWLTDSRNPSLFRLTVGYAFMAYWVVTRRLGRHYDLILANPGVVGNVLLFWLGRLLGVPVVGTAYSEEITLVLHGRTVKARLKRGLLKLSYRQAAGYIAVCDAARDLLVRLGVSKGVIDVIPPGINQAKVPAAVSSVRRQRRHRVLSVGRLIERKGFRDLIDAVDRLREELPALHLTIVGDGPERDRLRARIAKLNLGEHVTLAGSVGDEALAKLYVESAVFVLANRMLANGDVEGCPVVFAEAAAYGLPVIGGKVGGASSLIDDQKTGLLVAADDIDELAAAMRRLLSSPELGDQMGAAGRTKILRDHAPAVIGQQFTVALTRHVRDDGLR